MLPVPPSVRALALATGALLIAASGLRLACDAGDLGCSGDPPRRGLQHEAHAAAPRRAVEASGEDDSDCCPSGCADCAGCAACSRPPGTLSPRPAPVPGPGAARARLARVAAGAPPEPEPAEILVVPRARC